MKSNRFWIIATGALLLVSLGATFLLRSRTSGAVAHITHDGAVVRSIDLSFVDEPYSFTLDLDGGHNTVSVRRGGICVSHADCPDQTCVRQGWITTSAYPIVCLPHRLVIQIEGARATPDVDAVAR